MSGRTIMRAGDLLIVVDVQIDFCPGGRLVVPEGDAVVAPINQLIAEAPSVVLTQDWHPPDHFSFAVQHPGRAAFDTIGMDYGTQTLWPEHCVQESEGARFHPALDTGRAELIVRKGFRRAIDSYSAFFENDRRTPTGLAGYVRERGFTRVLIAGLAFDFCVLHSALDATRLGFTTVVLTDACRAIDTNGSRAAATAMLREAAVELA